MKLRLIILLSFILYTLNGMSQDITRQPPLLTYLSVEPYSGNIILEWEPSTYDGVMYYNIRVYDPSADGYFTKATIDGNTTHHSYYEYQVNQQSTRFSIEAVDSSGNESILSNTLCTTYLRSSYDSCRSFILFLWDELDQSTLADSFNLYFMNDSTRIQSNSGRVFFLTDFPKDEELYYYVETIRPGEIPTNSTKVCIHTASSKTPLFINNDQVTVENNNIRVSFTIDPQSRISTYYLLRAVKDTSHFDTIQKFFDYPDKHLVYTDDKTPVTTINHYMLEGYNSCGYHVQTSNTGSNIVLNLKQKDNIANLSWNAYKQWIGDIDNYMLYRYSRNYTVLDSFEIENNEVTYEDYLGSLIDSGYFDRVCYILEARETSNNPYGIRGKSRSNMTCTIISPPIPNAFTPDGDGMNDTYRPITTLIAKDYHLIITDRWGSKVFESDDPYEEWDGTRLSQGKVEAGVYVYYLKFTTQDGYEVTKNGYVSVLYPSR